jgi:hypothetical protein
MQFSQADEPGREWPPLEQEEQWSVAPMLNVFLGHFSTPLRAVLTFVPAAFVEQYAAPSME